MFKLQYNILSKVLKKIRLPSIINSTLGFDSKIEAGSSIVNSTIGKHSFVGYDASVINAEIGSFCSIANKVSIGGATHPVHFVSTSPVFLSHKDSVKVKYSQHDFLPEIKTVVGHDVWIGEGAYIKAGVSVGTGAVVGMGSVVTKDIPPYAIFAGNPASLIRYRFENEIINRLILSCWWDFTPSALSELGINFNDPQRFLDSLEGKG